MGRARAPTFVGFLYCVLFSPPGRCPDRRTQCRVHNHRLLLLPPPWPPYGQGGLDRIPAPGDLP
eukprot:14740304-Heterocapsa_arctica.AAC.1